MPCLWSTNWFCNSLSKPDALKLQRSLLKLFHERQIVKFTHQNDPITISAYWETISMEEMERHSKMLAQKLKRSLDRESVY